MSNSELVRQMIKKAKNGSKDAVAFLLKIYQPFVLDIVHSLNIDDKDKEEFIQEGLSIVLKAIYEYSFDNFTFDSYVRKVLKIALKDFKKSYYKFYEENVKLLSNKLNGENIYESEDSLIDASFNLNCTVVCDGEIANGIEVFVSSNSDTEREVINNILRGEIEKLFIDNNLINLEIEILKCTYGFYGYCFTNEEIIDKLGISLQDIERVLDDVLFKLRMSNEIKKFADYMDVPDTALAYIGYFQNEILCDNEEKNEVKENKDSGCLLRKVMKIL